MKELFILFMVASFLFFMGGGEGHAESEEIEMAVYREDIAVVELTSGTIHRTFMNHSIGSGDNMANRFGVQVVRNGEAVDLTGVSCFGYFRNAEGTNIALTNEGTVSGNVAYVTLPQACYNVEGQFTLSIKLIGGGITGTMRIVDGVVDNTNTGGAVAPTGDVPTYTEILAVYEQMQETLEDYTETVTEQDAKIESIRDDLEKEIGDYTEETINKWRNPEYNDNGVILFQHDDGSVHISGTPTSETLYIDHYFDSSLPQGDYVLSCRKKGTTTGQGRFFVCTRNQQNTGTKFIQFAQGIEYIELKLSNFSPYRCEIILFSDTTYDCDLYIQLERGTEATRYTRPTTAVDSVARNEIEEIRDAIENKNALLSNARNYVDVLKITEKSTVTKWGHSSGVVQHMGNTVHYSIENATNGGFFTDYFSSSSFVLQITRLSFDLAIEEGNVRVWLYGTMKTGGDYANVIKYPSIGHNEINIDFAYYDVYTTLDISKPIRFLITNGGEEISDFTVSNLELLSLITSQNYAEEYGEGLLFGMLDNIAGMIPQPKEQTFLKSPDGNKWLLSVSNNGSLSAKKITPNKSAFIGNSLLMGWGTFGMTASDNQHDYYYHVTTRIHQLDNTASYTHLSNGNLEHSTNDNDFNTAFNVIKPYLTEDIDLICIQLGDNVNTNEKVTQFTKQGGSFETMVDWIHQNCPIARLMWVGTWYPSIHDWLVDACAAKGVEFVDILPLSTTENKATLGDVVHRTEDRTQTITGSYIESSGALLVTASIYGRTYNITIPSYTSVTGNGDGTFTMVAPYTIIDSTGVQSHPNDSGMKAIAEKIMSQIGID